MLNTAYEDHERRPVPDPNRTVGRSVCLYFGCPDVDAAYTHLRAQSVDAKEPVILYLPGDESCATEILELFLTHGADPTIRNEDGMTAADLAIKRGLDDPAELLRSIERSSS